MNRLLALLGVLALVVSACGGAATTTTNPPPEPSTPASTSSGVPSVPTTTAGPVTTVEVTSTTQAEMSAIAYFLLSGPADGGGPFLVPVHRTVTGSEAVLRDALEQLLAGPTADEQAGSPSVSTSVPAATELLGVDLDDGVATVDLSGEFEEGGGTASMQARLAQLVYTVTRIPDVDSVVLHLDGRPVEAFSGEGLILEGPQTRDDYVDLLPAIFVNTPAWGEPVASPVTVSGRANVFEATFRLLVTDDDGAPLTEEVVTASCGTGCWGDFSVDVAYELDRDQFGAVMVWNESPRDGSQDNLAEYPIRLR